MPKRKHTDSTETDSAESNDNSPTTSGQIVEDGQACKRVSFDGVTLYYFQRSQGFSCVPSVGGTTLGMAGTHLATEKLALAVFESKERKEVDRQRRLAVISSGHGSDCNSAASRNGEGAEEGDSDEEEEEADDDDDEDTVGLQPLTSRDRRSMLRAAGVDVDQSEKTECATIRQSRQTCGCDCVNACLPDTCQCAINHIKCQVDRPSFPCACTRQGCENPVGRVEFNPFRVRSHFMHTMMRVREEEHGPLVRTPLRQSPRRHVRFDNNDSYCDSPTSSRAGSNHQLTSTPIPPKPIPSLTSIFQDGHFHHGYGLARYPSFNVEEVQEPAESTTYQISSLYQHVNSRTHAVTPQQEEKEDDDDATPVLHESFSTVVA